MSSPESPTCVPHGLEEIIVDNGEVDKGEKRVRKETERFSEWRYETCEQNFKRALSAWRKQAICLERLVTDSFDVNVIRKERDSLDSKLSSVVTCYDELTDLTCNTDDKASNRKIIYEDLEQDHYRLAKDVASRIRMIEYETKSSSSRSYSSKMSRRSREHIQAATETAVLKARVKFLDEEARKKTEIQQKKIELEQKEAELEKTQILKELDMAKAKLNAVVELEREDQTVICSQIDLPTTNKDDYVAKYVDGLRHTECNPNSTIFDHHYVTNEEVEQSHLNANELILACPCPSANVCPNDSDFQVNALPLDNSPAKDTALINSHQYSSDLKGVVKALAEHVSLSRLPPPEPGVFYGDCLAYPSWKNAFNTLIGTQGIPTYERIYYLSKYLGGPAKEIVEGFMLLPTDEAYTEAWALLEQRYGDPFTIANAFREKLNNWEKIPPRDGIALRKYSDFLKQCKLAMQTNKSLLVLNDDQENMKMLLKLPEWLTLRWGRIVSQWRADHQEFPPFSKFASFIAQEANIACDPVTSLQKLKASTKQTDGNRNSRPSSNSVGRGSYATETNISSTASNEALLKGTCIFCDRAHHINVCQTFLSKDVTKRKEFASNNGLCFGCLEQGHRSRDCQQRLKCAVCSRQHPAALHGDVPKAINKLSDSDTRTAVSHAGTQNHSMSGRNCQCSMIVPVWLSHSKNPDNEILVYALLDTQSDTTFVLDKTCEDLNISGPEVSLILSTMSAKNQVIPARKMTGLIVRGYNNSIQIPLPTTYSRELMPSNRNHIPTPEAARKWPHLERIANELMPLSDIDVGLLIGYNCVRALAPREVIATNGDEPYAQKTDLGWGIVGVVHCINDNSSDPIGFSHHILSCENPAINSNNSSAQISLQTTIKEMITPIQVAKMMELDFCEHKSEELGPSYDDLQFLKSMKQGIRRTDDHHYEIPLPLKVPTPVLPNNKAVASRRFRQLQSRFRNDNKYRTDYYAFMEDLISGGYAEQVPDTELECKDGSIWYIPHHGVYHPQKPNKIRIVFDCSARYRGECLNDCLLQGPDLTNKLLGVLCRFRREVVAFICDIEKMFLQFRVNPTQCNFLRFLWFDPSNPHGDPTDYRMKVHLFGAVSSPACANYGLKQIATDFEDEFGSEAADFLRNDFYVDDGLKSVSSVERAIDLIDKTQRMCRQGGLKLHKFVSNNRDILASIPPEDRAQGLRDIDLTSEDLPTERALGLYWCIESDTFNFRITLKDRPLTRRGVLSTIASIYDPLGFLAPVLLVGKQIMQQLCKDKVDWDTELPDDLRTQWETWRNDPLLLESVAIPRCIKPSDFGEVKSAEIHHFSDASTLGYGQCSFLRLIDVNHRVHVMLLMGKARVTPLKSTTIPRLELTAALVSVRVSAFLKKELDFKITKEVFWTDSRIVLGYISNDIRRFHVFVSNRVHQIRNQTQPNQWRYINTEENPADAGSRGLPVRDFISKSNWISGPSFLMQHDLTKSMEYCDEFLVDPDDPEVKQVKTMATVAGESIYSTFLERLEIFSDWNSAKRATAVCLRLMNKSHVKVNQSNYRSCNVEELFNAELRIIRLLQESAFKDDLVILRATSGQKSLAKSSKLYRLDPFIDENGILRVGGRIQKSDSNEYLKHPAIVPKRQHITELIIRHAHEMVHHQGRGITINTIRSNGFWILGCGSEVSYFISKCVICRKQRSKAMEQKMSDLPKDRVNPSPPFTYCAVDCFGPFYIKDGRRELKRWGVLFTCMASRAVHLETVNSMTTVSFINSLRRFMAVRGPIRQLRSDQGSNFVGASNELQNALSSLDNDRVRQFLLPHDCDYFEYKMNAPASSNMGGTWERQIRTVRSVLASLLNQCGSQLDDESLRTFMCEAMSVVNSRPLTTTALNDVTSPEALTPNHLLTMKTRILLPPPGNFTREDVYSRKRWRRVQHISNEFWHRWKREYLQNLQSRQKWIKPRPNLCIGDIVIVMDDNSPRNQWQLARVVEVSTGSDGLVRRAKVVVGDKKRDSKGKRVKPLTFLDRPIQKLVLLLKQ